jgi:hypothetical protein
LPQSESRVRLCDARVIKSKTHEITLLGIPVSVVKIKSAVITFQVQGFRLTQQKGYAIYNKTDSELTMMNNKGKIEKRLDACKRD